MAQERNTQQKALIADAVRELPHPTAADVFHRVRDRLPSVSLATVYRVLSRMAEEGQVLRVRFAGGEDVFDRTVCPHCHIRCRVCGRVRDVELGEVPRYVPHVLDDQAFTVEDFHLEFTGICQLCQTREQ